jgi:pimeloyl-ACP methyl ester carboxylesterase
VAILDFGPADRPPDLLFLHANGFNALTYRRILAPLADRCRILAIDQRGHGSTTLPTRVDDRTDWDDFRDDLLALLTVLDIRSVVLAGHSMGGACCLGAAARAPERIRRMLLLDPVILPREMIDGVGRGERPHSSLIEGARRRRADFASRAQAFEAYKRRIAFADWPDDMLADYLADGFHDLPNGHVRLACEPAWEASTFLAQANDPWSDFAATRCPIEILKAEHGSTCRTEGQEGALTASGLITLEIVPGASHFLPMERPELATDRLARALAAD